MSTLTLALVQTSLNWLDKAANLENFGNKIANIDKAVDLILLPETFATGFAISLDCAEPENGQVLAWLIATAKSANAVVAGSVLVEQGDKKANRFYWVWPSGEVKFYDKRHLFCLGKEGDFVKAGQQRQIFTINGFRVLPQVCYDLRFPVFQRNRNDYDVMINVANWPAARRNVWDTLLMARAMENQCYVVGVNRVGEDGNGVAHNGGTAVYDFKGDVLVAAIDNESDIVITTLKKEPLELFKQSFPAHLDADGFSLQD
ncbi:amidohydrolase [Pseudoalteromonas sp. NEC-BIFX-2020_002]|uniref:Amidohydrolase n=1 Tax=Pseudoalteromonas neustonica TaxID=1840331 RepID=A0ABU9TWV1_9GAMM|nr:MULTISPECIES: amidohydrolase [unclassified Pseudoalteromonas]NMR24594.1 amidohydrolase [Pseudoalteromonas sp. NEC-BIFX-2020_015]NNG42621.1 amidohydrolase [Pseudoalteromonas sp. NEC-BIFX-2020_002]